MANIGDICLDDSDCFDPQTALLDGNLVCLNGRCAEGRGGGGGGAPITTTAAPAPQGVCYTVTNTIGVPCTYSYRELNDRLVSSVQILPGANATFCARAGNISVGGGAQCEQIGAIEFSENGNCTTSADCGTPTTTTEPPTTDPPPPPTDVTSRVEVGITPRAGGLVSLDGSDLSTGITQDFTYNPDNRPVVSISAEAAEGYRFVNWTFGQNDRDYSERPTIEVVLQGDEFYLFTANFDRVTTTTEPPEDTTTTTEAPATTTEPPFEWRSCIDGELKQTPLPSDYRSAPFTGLGGGICWEPSTDVGFSPSLDNITFTHQRGSKQFPGSFQFDATNPSFALTYNVRFETNSQYFVVDPPQITLGPRQTSRVIISVKKETIEELGDGTTNFNLATSITEA